MRAWETMSLDEQVKSTNDKQDDLMSFLEEKFEGVDRRFDAVEQRLDII